MKLNNKGFAVTGILYTALLMFLVVISGILSMMSTRKVLLDKMKRDAAEEFNQAMTVFRFNYTGNYQTFDVPISGNYKVELWGASGGGKDAYGSYVSGTIELVAGQRYYVYVGEGGLPGTKGNDGTSTVGQGGRATFNGGGYGGNAGGGLYPYSSYTGGTSGGGATDIRLQRFPKYRYVRDYASGNTVNSSNHWIEIEVFDRYNRNIALNKPVTASVDSSEERPNKWITDGNTATANWTSHSSGLQWVEVDLGEEYEISKVVIRHYYGDGRTYHQTKTELYSGDRKTTDVIFDSAISGTYPENSAGRTSEVPNYLTERIIVAGGGGGGHHNDNGFDNEKSNAGGLVGYKGGLYAYMIGKPQYEPHVAMRGAGGTQDSGYKFGFGGPGDNSGVSDYCHGQAGGGGGYYGGFGGRHTDGNCHMIGGGGGSSFISGHFGSNAVDEDGNHTGQPNHYSGLTFSNTIMIDGGGYEWTDIRANQTAMPKPNGSYYPLGEGHTGDGYARISLIQ